MSLPNTKWILLPPRVLENAFGLSNPYAQSIPSSPTIGSIIRTPTPAERLRSNGLYRLFSLQALPASRKPSTQIVVDCSKIRG